MSDKNRRVLPGLPSRFSQDRDGFRRLCDLLGLQNRSHRQFLINTDRVKRATRHLKGRVAGRPTSERERVLLTAFYEEPEERRDLWKQAIEVSVDGHGSYVPSLDYQALLSYDAGFHDRDVEEARLRDALSEFPDAVVSLSEVPEWQRPVLAVWPDLHRDRARMGNAVGRSP